MQQLGAMAAALAKQTAEEAQKQEDIVLKDAEQLNLESLYKLPPLRTSPAGAEDADTEGTAEAEDAAEAEEAGGES